MRRKSIRLLDRRIIPHGIGGAKATAGIAIP
jgi:hypothetical protein